MEGREEDYFMLTKRLKNICEENNLNLKIKRLSDEEIIEKIRRKIELAFEDKNNQPIIKKYKITKKLMKKKYHDLSVNGAGQVVKNHWVAASALVYPQTLSFVFDKKHKIKGQKMAFFLIDYFEQNRVGPVLD